MSRMLTLGVVLLLCCLAPLAVAQDHHEDATTHGEESHMQAQEDGHEAMTGDHGADTAEHGAGGHAAEEMHGDGHGGGHGDLGAMLPLWSAIPFAGILLSIALFPLFAPVWWHHHFPKISAFWALLFAIPFLIAYKGAALHEILHIYIADYIPFIILLWGLFTASGGILLKGSLVGRPVVNLILLLIGTILASWMGTTGAAMVMIRPLLRANKNRQYKVHSVVFFIFLVANIGGSLTPLGDPPLFLGFLHGVPFFWTFNLFPHMAVMVVALLLIYFVLDTILFNKEKEKFAAELAKHEGEKIPLSLHGTHNFLFLAGIIGAVLFSGIAKLGSLEFAGLHIAWSSIVRDVFILLMVFLSIKTTKQEVRKGNEFNWFPIKEVAYLFAGIFMCIIPMLAMLKAGMAGHLAFIIEATKEPVQFFWITGALSSFLDNAPTYLTFFNLAEGRLGLSDAMVNGILTGNLHHEAEFVFREVLRAIAAGAVFFGAMTYIGNAPNFMVRSIAEEQNIKMPSFFGYMLWSIGILVPLFAIVTFIFFI